MRRIRSHLAAAGPLTRWIHEVKGSNGNMNYAQWYDPCPRSPPDHTWYPKREREATLVVILNYYNRRWGPQRKSSQRSGGWKTCPRSSIGCNFSRFFLNLFLLFHVNVVIFVGAACQCLSMVGHRCFHELIYHLRPPASQTGLKSTLRSRNSACWNPSRWDIPSIHPAKHSYIQQKNRISKSPSPWKKTRNLLVSNFLRQSRALRKLTKSKFVIVHRSVQ